MLPKRKLPQVTTMVPTWEVSRLQHGVGGKEQGGENGQHHAGTLPPPPPRTAMARILAPPAPGRMLFHRMVSWRIRKARRVTKMGLPEKITATTLAWPW